MTVVNPKSISGITSVTTASGSDNLLTFHTNNTTERLRIQADGKIGIGDNSPDRKLHVNSASDNECAIFESTDTEVTLEFKDLTGTASLKCRDDFRLNNSTGELLRIDSGGRLLVGATAKRNVLNQNGNSGGDSTTPLLYAEGVSDSKSLTIVSSNTNAHRGSVLGLARTRATSVGGNTIVAANDNVGQIIFAANDGVDLLNNVATIRADIDGTPGANDVPGRLVFSTTADGANTSTERMRITNAGVVHIGNTFSAHSEGDDLVIGGAGWRGMTIYGEGGGGVIQFADDGSNRAGQILYSHSSNHMLFRTNGNVDRMMITDDGYIGAGVASPSARFHAQDDSATETVMIKLRNYKSGVNTKPTIHFEAATSTGQGATSEIQGLAGTDAGGSNSANDSGMKFIVRHGGAGTQREAFTLKADGNMYFPSGQGISFSATSDGTSMSSELFDDYEEGTFTPLLGGSNYGTYNVTGTGKYTRVGRAIFCEWKFTNKDLDNNASGQMRIRGWPFAFSADANAHRPISSNFMMHNVQLPTSGDNNIYNIYGDSNGIAMNGMRNNDDTGWTSWDIANFESGTMYFEGSCFMMAS